MTTVISGSSPSITFSDATTQTTAFTSTPSVTSITTSADATINGVTVGKGTNSLSTNTAVGASALAASNSGTGHNVANGYQALTANLTGLDNVGVGYQALLTTQNDYQNTAVGSGALKTLNGASNNTAVGYSALLSTTTGGSNVGIGVQALQNNTTGSYNTAVGYGSAGGLAGATGAIDNITAFGYSALAKTTGTGNTAVGRLASYNSTSGYYNTSVGDCALYSNTTATNNIAVGYQTGYYQTGGSNTAVGSGALLGASGTSTGTQTTAIGYQAGYSATTGNDSVMVGHKAGYSITSASNNICIGSGAGNYTTPIITGAQNIHIGAYTIASSSSASYEIVIGYASGGKGPNTAFINPNSGNTFQGNNSSTWAQTSDQRLKKNIVDNTVGLSAINGIQVRNFEYRLPEEVTELPQNQAIQKTGLQLGVIAQELKEILPDCVKEEGTGVLSVNSDSIMWHMINAIKELNAKVIALETKLGV